MSTLVIGLTILAFSVAVARKVHNRVVAEAADKIEAQQHEEWMRRMREPLPPARRPRRRVAQGGRK